ncbi:MAG: dipeptidase [Clostridia bacterium]|nr:dipeptidase [Clostridia bacterium]
MKYPYTIVDSHCDTCAELLDRGEELLQNEGHISLTELKKYRGYIQFFAAWIDENKENWLSRACAIIDKFYQELEKNKDSMLLIQNSSDLKRALDEKKVGAILAIEDGRAICGELSNLRTLYRLGVRAMTLAWNHDNDLTGGTLTKDNDGLTSFGKDVVREMNRLGMMVDVSHLPKKSFWDVLEITDSPVFASHSNCEAIHKHPRNLDDEQIKALIQTGGMLGISVYPAFLTDKEASLDDVIKHIDHVLSLGGEKILGIGTDFDGIPNLPVEMKNAGDLHLLFDKMKKIGYKDSLIDAITHGNFVNYLDKALKNEKS